jgi:seryl-tRNA synthetase
MRSREETKRELDEVQQQYNARSSMIRMLEGNTPENDLKSWREELKPIEQRLKQLRAELG